jgi:hypothetical protein
MAILSELSLDERGQLYSKIPLSLEEPSEEEVFQQAIKDI